MLGVALASLLAHGAVIATTNIDLHGGRDLGDDPELVAAVNFQFSCWGDAGLALVAQSMACTAPGIHGAECQEQAVENYGFDVQLCNSLREDPISADEVALMSPAEMRAIEALPLLDVPSIDELEAAQLLEEEIQQKIEEAQERISQPRQAGQVIEVTAPDLEATPENARFLSEYDTKVDKETVARGSTEEMVSKPAPKELPIDEAPKELQPDPKASGEPSEEQALLAKLTDGSNSEGTTSKSSPLLAMRAQEFRPETTVGELSGAEALEANGLAAASRGDGSIKSRAQAAQEGREAVNAGSGQRSSLPNLRPSEDMLSRVVGGGSVDKLDGVESGDFTAINSKKWKFAGFFNRMKRQVAQNWHPDVVYTRRDPSGKVYGTKDRITVLEVSLKPNGSLAKVVVFQESGVDFLDSEAINAFELAQPFPFPPADLVDEGSQLITFSFGFHFQVGSRRDTWQIFRYN